DHPTLSLHDALPILRFAANHKLSPPELFAPTIPNDSRPTPALLDVVGATPGSPTRLVPGNTEVYQPRAVSLLVLERHYHLLILGRTRRHFDESDDRRLGIDHLAHRDRFTIFDSLSDDQTFDAQRGQPLLQVRAHARHQG